MKRFIMLLLAFAITFSVTSCSKDAKPEKKQTESVSESKTEATESQSKALVTFYELGSVNCIPCKQMKPVMEAIEKKYGDQVKVIFYDVNKEEEKSEEFGIRLIPTQVFHDKDGKEIHRHEGFYPEAEIDKFLQAQGLKVNN